MEQIKKVCQCIEPTCGIHFMGGRGAKYCPECREERKLYSLAKSNAKTEKPRKIYFKDEREGNWYGQVFFKIKIK